MSVVSFEFLGFLAALAVVYYVLPMRVRKWALLAGSAAFWLLCGWQGAAYLTAETLLIWGCARLIGRFSERRGVCRALLIGGMVTVFGAMVLMKALLQLQALPDGLLVPIGLSYFTFQSVGYLIDVYRGKVAPEKKLCESPAVRGLFPANDAGPDYDVEATDAAAGQPAPPFTEWLRVRCVPDGVGLFQETCHC